MQLVSGEQVSAAARQRPRSAVTIMADIADSKYAIMLGWPVRLSEMLLSLLI